MQAMRLKHGMKFRMTALGLKIAGHKKVADMILSSWKVCNCSRHRVLYNDWQAKHGKHTVQAKAVWLTGLTLCWKSTTASCLMKGCSDVSKDLPGGFRNILCLSVTFSGCEKDLLALCVVAYGERVCAGVEAVQHKDHGLPPLLLCQEGC